MRKLVFIAIIASLAMTGCIQKESEKKEGSSDKKVLTENVKLATCNINVGGIRFTKSKTAERMVSHFLAKVPKVLKTMHTPAILRKCRLSKRLLPIFA